MGNLNIKGYTPTTKESIQGGTNKVWKIINAKKSSKKEGSIFYFEKKKYKNFNFSKSSKEANFAIMRREAQNLSKYMHPSVLKILEPFHEDNHVMGFVTEKVETTLARIFEQKAEIPIRSDLTELKIILMELLEGISYLNEGDFEPQGISLGEGKSDMINPNPAFSSLELLETGKRPEIKTDIFSLVMVLWSVFKLKSDNYGSPFFLKPGSDIGACRQKIRDLSSAFAQKDFLKVFPEELKPLAIRAINSTPSMRPSLTEFKLNPWFNDNLLRGLYNLNEFYKLELPKQKIYLKAFAKIVPKYSSRIVKERILPFLMTQLLNPNNMYEVVTILLYILKKRSIASESERKEAIWPIFQKLLTSKKISGQVLYVIITYIDLICAMLTKEEIKTSIVSLFFKCFDCKVPLIQILTISRTDGLAKLIDFSEIKNKLLPRILLLCDDSDQKVKRTALRFIHSKLSVCDASLAQNGLLKMIERNLVSGNSPSTNMLLLEILKQISGSFSTEDLNNQSGISSRVEDKDSEIEFVPLEQLIQTAKVEGEGFDFLFSNKPGGTGPTINDAFGLGSPNPNNKPQEDMFAGMNIKTNEQSNTMDFTQFNNAGKTQPPQISPPIQAPPKKVDAFSMFQPPQKKSNNGFSAPPKPAPKMNAFNLNMQSNKTSAPAGGLNSFGLLGAGNGGMGSLGGGSSGNKFSAFDGIDTNLSGLGSMGGGNSNSNNSGGMGMMNMSSGNNNNNSGGMGMMNMNSGNNNSGGMGMMNMSGGNNNSGGGMGLLGMGGNTNNTGMGMMNLTGSNNNTGMGMMNMTGNSSGMGMGGSNNAGLGMGMNNNSGLGMGMNNNSGLGMGMGGLTMNNSNKVDPFAGITSNNSSGMNMGGINNNGFGNLGGMNNTNKTQNNSNGGFGDFNLL